MLKIFKQTLAKKLNICFQKFFYNSHFNRISIPIHKKVLKNLKILMKILIFFFVSNILMFRNFFSQFCEQV
jgi:hypothetical protein